MRVWRILALGALLSGAAAMSRAQGTAVQFTIRSAGSGAWSDANTWAEKRVPKAGDFVQVRAGHRVTYDVHSDQAVRMIHVAGTLAFSREKSTRLDVGLLKIQAGEEASEEGFDCDAHTPVPSGAVEKPALEIALHPSGRMLLVSRSPP